MSSAVVEAEQTVEAEPTVEECVERANESLCQYFRTMVAYCQRQGLSFSKMRELLDAAEKPKQVEPTEPVGPYSHIEFPKLEVADRGISDMRGKH